MQNLIFVIEECRFSFLSKLQNINCLFFYYRCESGVKNFLNSDYLSSAFSAPLHENIFSLYQEFVVMWKFFLTQRCRERRAFLLLIHIIICKKLRFADKSADATKFNNHKRASCLINACCLLFNLHCLVKICAYPSAKCSPYAGVPSERRLVPRYSIAL